MRGRTRAAPAGATEASRDRAEANEAQLAAADRRKGVEFLAMLAHELRNPLAAVQNAVAVAIRSGTREALERCKDVTARQVGNFAHLINDLLDVSRITLGRDPPPEGTHRRDPRPPLRRRGREADIRGAGARAPELTYLRPVT